MFVLLKKEISGFLNSILGYVVMAVFLLVNGLFLWVFPLESNILDFGYANIDGLFLIAPFVFLFLIPAITMRFFAEEKKSGTIELLMTRPLTDLQVITGKIFCRTYSCYDFHYSNPGLFLFSLSIGFPEGNIDTGGMWGSYIGLLFLGASFVAIGLVCFIHYG